MKYYKKGSEVFVQIEEYNRYKGHLRVGNTEIVNPTEQQLKAEGYTLYNPTKQNAEDKAAQEKEYYESRVESKIRQRYSMSNELAILRQRDTKPQEFEEYNKYCEDCKAAVKAEIAAEQQEQTI